MTALAPAAVSEIGREPISPKRRLPVLRVDAMLQAQQTLTAVDRFAQRHEGGDLPSQEPYYRDLIPFEQPRAGQQYAFEVDLDACTGCKACVTACHTMNGLDESEIWRTVGLLHGGTHDEPVLQTVTTSCHHCVEPACLQGCPVRAYEKDPVTGIVRHLDDQCFGCQYCTLMCPYDAPKYNARAGIVRKCDMCEGRLSHGEAPACVQACPNQAISIRVVDQADAVARSDAGTFLPGAPAPEHTLPTTIYQSKRAFPGNMLPADFYRTSPEHSHPPLVVMLTLTQLSAGAFGIALLVERLSGHPAGSPIMQAAFATSLALVALGASVLHLGRPWLAWRAFLGFGTSWLSREAVGFGLFAALAMLHGALVSGWFPHWVGARIAPLAQVGAAVFGAAGVFCSVMVYVVTRRAQWSGTQTGIKFFGSAVLLGAATVLAVGRISSAPDALDPISRPLLWLVVVTNAVKLAFEASGLRHARDARLSVMKRMATVMLADLRTATTTRFAAALAGGLILPLVLFHSGLPSAAVTAFTAFMLVLLIVGELAERYMFFRAAPASRMPGGIR
jgi:Fe-S-cluster-containing dehydrogenase component/DMSO reductase anchor subunit